MGDDRRKDEEEAAKRRRAVELEERRKRFRETTPSQRLETCLQLSELGGELRDAVRRTR